MCDAKKHYKQVLIIRKDLNMRRGKECSQCAHASMKVVLENMEHPDVKAWLSAAFTKVVVTADTEDQLRDLYNEAIDAGIVTAMIIDSGKTEFNGVPTLTVLAIGPGLSEDIDKITGHLKLR